MLSILWDFLFDLVVAYAVVCAIAWLVHLKADDFRRLNWPALAVVAILVIFWTAAVAALVR